MIFDTDDLYDGNDRMDLLMLLKAANPNFKMTAFAIPALADDDYWNGLPDWIEVAVHGWAHPHPREAESWSYDQAVDVLLSAPSRFVDGFKAPGWQISDGTYQACLDLGWWVADQHYNDARRPAGLRVHCENDGIHIHTHVQNVCGNGLEESMPYLTACVRSAEKFQFVSEAVYTWKPEAVAA